MRTMLSCFLVLAALAAAAFADVNATGNWSGSFNMTRNGETKDSTALLKLKQSGNDITGTVGPNEDEQVEIKKGKIEGDKITLEVEHDGSTMVFNLVLTADRITGEAKLTHEGETATAKIDTTRSK